MGSKKKQKGSGSGAPACVVGDAAAAAAFSCVHPSSLVIQLLPLRLLSNMHMCRRAGPHARAPAGWPLSLAQREAVYERQQ